MGCCFTPEATPSPGPVPEHCGMSDWIGPISPKHPLLARPKHLISTALPWHLARYTHRPSLNVSPYDATNNGKDGEHPALFTTSVTISHHSPSWP